MEMQSAKAATFTIRNKRGLHARASAKFVETAASFNAEVKVAKDGMEVIGTSIMGLMLLAASKGQQINVRATGPQAAAAIDALSALVAGRFDED